MIFRSLLAMAACSLAMPASALLVRPDRDDAEYRELASKYASAIALDARGGEGVLIAPRWVLTSAPNVRMLREKKVGKLTIGARDFAIQQVFVHEGLGLVALKTDVTHVPFTRIYRGIDEAGRTAVVASHGETGKIGDSAPPVRDGKARASINTIDRVTTQTLGMRLKAADEASDLQGALAPGDLGAPLYFEMPDGLAVAGIATATDGTWETYARVTQFGLWIEATMVELGRQEAEALLGEK